MARIFISHSSRDNDAASRMKAWLERHELGPAFLDFDKSDGIPPGAEWEKKLYHEVEQAQAVIIIQTSNWQASKWCFVEFAQARALGKKIYIVIETPADRTRIAPEIQALDLTGDRESGLEQLYGELNELALGPGGFKWDSSRSPFPGLTAFQEEDAAVYFGREDDIQNLKERLEARRVQGGAKLIALLGASGSGKSSLLRAGVIPRLKRTGRDWIVAPPVRPGARPVDALARTLAMAGAAGADWRKVKDDLIRPDPKRALDDFASDLRVKAGASEAQILIPIDQAEELFGVADPDETKRFLEVLNHALSENLPFLAVMTLRSDFLGQLQSASSLKTRFEEFSLKPMPLARIPDIIRGPAKVAGIGFEEAFLQQAVLDAETEDALPLLAFALRKLLNWPSNNALTLERYRALADEKAGLTPLENAVRQAADEALEEEPRPLDAELAALREAFVPAMVRVDDKGQYVRRPALWDALPEKSRPLLERLAKARLLIIGQERGDRVVEAAHEALLRKWPWLNERLDTARVFLIGKPQLEQDLRDWVQAPATKEAKASAWLTGLKLNRARRWLIEYPSQLTRRERTFIRASIRHVEREDRQKEETRRRAIANESRALAGLSQAASLQGFYTDAVKLALAAWPRSMADERPMLSQTMDALGKALSGPLEVTPRLQHDDIVQSATFSPDGKWVVTASNDTTNRVWDAAGGALIGHPECYRVGTGCGGAARVWDAATGAPTGTPLRHQREVASAAFSLDGRRVVTASFDYTARVWDAATGTSIGRALRHEGPVKSALFSLDDARVVTASYDGTTRVWDAATGAPIGSPMRHEEDIISATFSLDGGLVAVVSGHTVQVWDATAGAPIEKSMQHEEEVDRAWFSPDCKRVVTASGNSARVWDVATGAPIGKPLRHDARILCAAFSPDGALVVTASEAEDRTARVWEAATGTPIGKPLRHEGSVYSALFSPDGAFVATASWDKTAQIWEAATGAPIGRSLQHEGPVNSASFSPDGKRVLTASEDRTARVWDAPIRKLLQHGDDVLGASFSPNGALVVTMSNDKKARVWDAATGAPIGNPMQHEEEITSATFSPDGGLVLTTSKDKASRIWDAATGAPISNPVRHEEEITSASFSLDGPLVAIVSGHTAQVLDAATGAPIGKALQHVSAVRSAVFSVDGARVVTTSDAKNARVWDTVSGAPIGNPMRHEEEIISASFSRDGARVATASRDVTYTTRVWDAATGAPIGKPVRQGGLVGFSPDGSLAVTTSFREAQVWDVATGSPIGRALQHEDLVLRAAFSPDGARVVTASFRYAQVWDAATGAPIGQPLRHAAGVNSAAFSPDGRWLMTASSDNTAAVWRAPPVAPNIVATACKMLGGNHDTAGLLTRYGIDVKDPICTGNEPAPDRSRMIER